MGVGGQVELSPVAMVLGEVAVLSRFKKKPGLGKRRVKYQPMRRYVIIYHICILPTLKPTLGTRGKRSLPVPLAIRQDLSSESLPAMRGVRGIIL